MRELETVGAKSIGFDDLRAGFDIGLVDAEDGFRLGGVEFIEAALRANGLMQHGAHGAIGNEDRIFDAFVEVENFHRELGCSIWLLFYTSTEKVHFLRG